MMHDERRIARDPRLGQVVLESDIVLPRVPTLVALPFPAQRCSELAHALGTTSRDFPGLAGVVAICESRLHGA